VTKLSKKALFLLFIAGISITLIVLPLLEAIGVPSYATILEVVFGDNKLIGTLFSVAMVALLFFTGSKLIKRKGKT